MTRFQKYHETNFACKYKNPLYKTQYSEILVEYDKGFDMTTGKIKFDPYATHHLINEDKSYIPVNLRKNAGNPGGNSTYFGAIHYDIHMKIDYTISRTFQEMSLSELETLHQLCELERTQILQSLALAVLKIPYAGYLLSGNRPSFLDYEGNILWFYTCTKKVSPLYMFLRTNVVKKESPYSTKIKYILLIHFQDEHIFGIPQSHVDQ